MTYENFIKQWWDEYIDNHADDGYNLEEIFTQMGYTKESHLDDDEEIVDFLRGLGADDVYEFFFGYGSTAEAIDDVPDTQDFLLDMYKKAAEDIGDNRWSYAESFMLDMSSHSEGYSNPDGFFDDLQRGGCSSGMIGMLIYNDNCKQIYIKHIDDMEEFIEDFEEELGCPVKNENHLPHYTFVCWLCYEELAYRIARELFPDRF